MVLLADLSRVLDPSLEHTIEHTFKADGAEYAVVEQKGDIESGRALVRFENGTPILISADFSPEDSAVAGLPTAVLEHLGIKPGPGGVQVVHGAAASAMAVGGGTRTADEIDGLIYDLALSLVGDAWMDSAKLSPAATNHGHLACAWAVNRIVEKALGRPVGGGLSTASMYLVLKSKDMPVPAASARAGNIIISPTTGTNVGHVGILGKNGKIYSNSSMHGMWEQNRTTGSWSAYYHDQKGLPVIFYQLDPSRFP